MSQLTNAPHILLEASSRMHVSETTRQKAQEGFKKEVNVSKASIWEDRSLSSGYPSLILLFTFLEKAAVVQGGSITHQYMVGLKKSIENQGLKDLSIFSGAAGIAFAVSQANSIENRYSSFLKTLNGYLADHLASRYLHPIQSCLSAKNAVPSNLYDSISGLCGIGRYFLEFLSENIFYDLSIEIIETLIALCQDTIIESNRVPGWYLSTEDPVNWLQDKRTFKGNFNLGLAHGVTGILAFLSIATLKGVCIEGQIEAMQKITNWIQKYSFQDSLGCYRWSYSVSWDEAIDHVREKKCPSRDAWCYGVPGISRTLFLAGKALKNNELKEFALKAFSSIFKRPQNTWGLPGPGICHGVAGLLLITKSMLHDCEKEVLRSATTDLQAQLISSYNPNAVFGYRDLEPNKKGILTEVDRIGLLEGAIGTLLTLHDSLGDWRLPFLIHA